TKLTTPGSYSDSTGNACIFATGSADSVFSSGPNTTVSGGGGDDVIFASAPGARVFGGEGADIIQVSAGGLIGPGPGRNTVTCSGTGCTVAILATCEITSGATLTGPGNGTLITPIPLADLRSRGVNVSGFTDIRVEQHACDSSCVQKPNCSNHGT